MVGTSNLGSWNGHWYDGEICLLIPHLRSQLNSSLDPSLLISNFRNQKETSNDNDQIFLKSKFLQCVVLLLSPTCGLYFSSAEERVSPLWCRESRKLFVRRAEAILDQWDGEVFNSQTATEATKNSWSNGTNLKKCMVQWALGFPGKPGSSTIFDAPMDGTNHEPKFMAKRY